MPERSCNVVSLREIRAGFVVSLAVDMEMIKPPPQHSRTAIHQRRSAKTAAHMVTMEA
jgi:hypothetical protein